MGTAGADAAFAMDCVRSSLFLARVLNRCGLDAAFQSGRPVDQAPHGLTTDFGVLTASGWVSHAWVKAGDFLIDITADQFGHAPVILTSIGDPAYRGGDRAECRLIPTASGIAAVDDIWTLWCENFERERLLMRPIRCM